jgi:succinoglycan biosynthesis transport protein ExoP
LDIRTLLSFLRRRGWIIVAGVMASGLTTFFITRGLTPVYETTASILVINQVPASSLPPAPGPTPAGPPTPAQLNDILISERLIKTYVELVARPVILEAASQRLNGAYSARQLADKVSVSNAPIDTQILKISVRDNDPALAAAVANAVAQSFIEENLREIGRPGTLSISQSANVPTSPVEPRVGLYTAVAVVLGAVVAIVFARGVEYLDDTIKTPDDVASLLDVPTLGVIGRAGSNGLQRTLRQVSGRSDLSPFLEDVRELRTRIHFLRLDLDLRTLVVVSQHAEEGKTTTAASLAEVLAEAGDRVILVDANLRRPRLHNIYGVSNDFGLTGLLLQQDSENVLLASTRVENLRLLPSGPLPLSPSELLTSKRMMQTMASLREHSDYVIFDTSPLASASDALILASKVDGTLHVVQAGRCRSPDLKSAISRLREAKATVLGVVLNKAKSSGRQYAYGEQLSFGRSSRYSTPGMGGEPGRIDATPGREVRLVATEPALVEEAPSGQAQPSRPARRAR